MNGRNIQTHCRKLRKVFVTNLEIIFSDGKDKCSYGQISRILNIENSWKNK